MSFSIEQIQAAQQRIAPYIVRTPLLRLYALDAQLGCQVYAKAECMQTTGSFKLRGAMNAVLALSPEQLSRGVVAASSGNHGRGIAYAAKRFGAKVTIVMPHTVTPVKVEAIRALGAETVFCETPERFRVAEQICARTGAVMIPSFDDENVMAGQGTAGLEIMQQAPEIDRVVVPVSGGGLLSGIATAVKSVNAKVGVYGAEPSVLPRYSSSLKAGSPQTVEQKHSIADALVAQRPGEKCFPVIQRHVDGVATVDDDCILQGMKLLLAEGKLLAEPSACIGLGAVLQGTLAVRPGEKVCFVISGGNVGLQQLAGLV